MPGALLELIQKGESDNYLIGNPTNKPTLIMYTQDIKILVLNQLN